MTTQEVKAFLEGFQTLMMASMTVEGQPHASTAPFVQDQNSFYILISTVAQHGRNLLDSKHVSLLFAEDENENVQPFARKRVTVDAEVSEIDRDTARFSEIIEHFAERFEPELVRSLSQMGDFHLFKLSPLGGSAVMGFGKAYRLNSDLEVITHVSGQHQHNSANR